MNNFYGLYYSPWTVRANWALKARNIKFKYNEYIPLLGEPFLRMKTGGKNSVPVLITGNGSVVGNSFEIAQWAEVHGSGDSILLKKDQEMKSFIDEMEVPLSAARIVMTKRLRQNSTALKESLPSFFFEPFRTFSIPMAWLGASYLIAKYPLKAKSDQELLVIVSKFIDSIKLRLANSEYIFESFSFADMAAASFFQFVMPVNEKYIPLKPASKECWQDLSLAKNCSSLLDWRDSIFKKHFIL